MAKSKSGLRDKGKMSRAAYFCGLCCDHCTATKDGAKQTPRRRKMMKHHRKSSLRDHRQWLSRLRYTYLGKIHTWLFTNLEIYYPYDNWLKNLGSGERRHWLCWLRKLSWTSAARHPRNFPMLCCRRHEPAGGNQVSRRIKRWGRMKKTRVPSSIKGGWARLQYRLGFGFGRSDGYIVKWLNLKQELDTSGHWRFLHPFVRGQLDGALTRRFQWMAPNDLIGIITPGSTVCFLTPNGIGRNGVEYKESKGRATICSPSHIVVNMGGRYGTPGVVTPENIVSASIKSLGKIFAEQ